MAAPPSLRSTCYMCGAVFDGWGNGVAVDADAPDVPVTWCDDCNIHTVIPMRIAVLEKKKDKIKFKGDPVNGKVFTKAGEYRDGLDSAPGELAMVVWTYEHSARLTILVPGPTKQPVMITLELSEKTLDTIGTIKAAALAFLQQYSKEDIPIIGIAVEMKFVFDRTESIARVTDYIPVFNLCNVATVARAYQNIRS